MRKLFNSLLIASLVLTTIGIATASSPMAQAMINIHTG